MVIDVVGANGKDKKQHQFDVKFSQIPLDSNSIVIYNLM